LKPIQLTSELPFGNDQTMEDIGLGKKATSPLDNIPPKSSIQLLKPLTSHNQIMPDFDKQPLTPLPKMQREAQLPLIRKSKK